MRRLGGTASCLWFGRGRVTRRPTSELRGGARERHSDRSSDAAGGRVVWGEERTLPTRPEPVRGGRRRWCRGRSASVGGEVKVGPGRGVGRRGRGGWAASPGRPPALDGVDPERRSPDRREAGQILGPDSRGTQWRGSRSALGRSRRERCAPGGSGRGRSLPGRRSTVGAVVGHPTRRPDDAGHSTRRFRRALRSGSERWPGRARRD